MKISSVQSTIMIVDTTPARYGGLVDILSAQGFDVSVFACVKTALKYASQTTPDIILLGADASKINPYGLCDKLKAQSALMHVPVIFVNCLDKKKAFECGAVDCISTPFALEEISKSIKMQVKVSKLEVLEKVALKITALEKQYYTELDNFADAILHVNQLGEIIYCNHVAEQYFGYCADELVGSQIEMLIPDKYKKSHIISRDKYMAEPVDRPMSDVKNLVGQKKNGEVFQVDISLSTLPSEYGGVTSVEIRDITAQVRLTKEMQWQRRFIQDAFTKTTDGLLITNIDGEIVGSNLAINKQFGYSDDEIAGIQMRFLYSSEDEYEKILLQLRCLNDGVECKPCVVTFRRKDMTSFIAKVNAVLTKDNVDGEDGYFFMIRDISERLDMEQEHKSLVKQLLQAQKMEVLGQLTGGVAHDFNNILASIMGFTELVAELVDQELDLNAKAIKLKITDYLDEVLASGTRAQSLILQMLTFSRSGESSELELFDMSVLVVEAIKLLKPVFPASINIQSNIYKNNPLIMADSVQLHQVVMNLCINARDAMNGKGDIDLRLSQSVITDGICSSCHQPVTGEYLELAITDSGPGIECRVKERLFEPFFTTKKIGKGTGMGLAMAHGILHRHHGHIIVVSKLGQGTTFRLLFPLYESEVATELDKQVEQLDEVT